MGRRRGRGQRTFNPQEKKKDVGQEVMDRFNSTWEKISELARKRALGNFLDAIQKDRESFVGELIIESQAAAMTVTGFDLQRKRAEMKQERERTQEILREEEEKLKRAIDHGRDAAERAFPGVEDEDG